ncbi:hypothetical protein [uncultured Sphingomonas sp.]|uniref:hypothetical protein n=1 Tax=uncultured Sphingomonas sp. TaxID=158754 RepID=UPI0025F00B79|nr:hypothetical protein [uncultured Sphingomonas sp.]
MYPRLLPKLGEHVLVLLLPALPQPALLKAIRECGVSLHTYRLSNTAKGKVEFDADFLRLCGLA